MSTYKERLNTQVNEILSANPIVRVAHDKVNVRLLVKQTCLLYDIRDHLQMLIKNGPNFKSNSSPDSSRPDNDREW